MNGYTKRCNNKQKLNYANPNLTTANTVICLIKEYN